jgi:inorganic pyrophosphatase
MFALWLLKIVRREEFAMHPWHDVPFGKKSPHEVNTIIEIPLGSNVKYELDKASGLLRVDRILYSAVYYPANHGFMPQTLAEDKDPLDVLVLCQEPVMPLTAIPVCVIGLMTMMDTGFKDHKIISVALGDPEFNSYKDAHQLPPPHKLLTVRRFFEDYKQLECKAVEVDDFESVEAAYSIIRAATAAYETAYGGKKVEQAGGR